jgi:hypothetical protein
VNQTMLVRSAALTENRRSGSLAPWKRPLIFQMTCECLTRGEAFLQPHFFSVAQEAALEIALRYRITAYDARFVTLADQLGNRLITEDARLFAAAPSLTQSLAEARANP